MNKLFFNSYILILFFSISIIYSQPTNTPILTLNTEMHTTRINRISIDGNMNYILTSSNDKTAKLWNAKTGELIRTIRVPMDLGNEGMLYASSISPDAKFIAVGGWTGWDWFEKCFVYIYDPSTGEMIKRLGPLETTIGDIEFSRDGKYLACALHGGYGINIYDAKTWKLVKQLEDFGDDVYSVTFDFSGRLAAACFDGYIRLYDREFNLLHKKKAEGGSKPFSVDFTADGRRLALGYDDSPNIQVLNGLNLSVLYEPDIKGVNTIDERLEMVAFSPDGKYLYAAGFATRYIENDYWYIIRRWENGGRGDYTDIVASQGSIHDIKATNNYSLVYSSSAPDFGLINEMNKSLIFKTAEIYHFNSNDKTHFRVNANATEIGFTPYGLEPLTFSLKNRQLIKRELRESPYKEKSSKVIVTDWLNSEAPRINYKATNFLEANEISRAVDICSDESAILFGTEWALYSIGLDNTIKWRTVTQAVVWALKTAGNNKVVVAALSNGTIRWFNLKDGKVLLNLYLHPESDKWILWTPSGYYDCSPGAENLIGWNVNNGSEKAPSYYSASRFRNVYYRPDLIDKILEELDENSAIQVVNEERDNKEIISAASITSILPPTISILEPKNDAKFNSNKVVVKYKVESQNKEAIKSIKFFIDGRPTKTITENISLNKEQAIELTLPSRDCKLTAVAENKFAYSEPAIISLYWTGTLNEKNEELFKPKLYILAIGVSEYQKPELRLKYPAKDAKDFVSVMAEQKGVLYRDIEVKLLTDKDATKENILDGLEWLQRQTTKNDIAMLFLSGHGTNDNIGTFYYLPVGADPERIKSTCVMYVDFKNTVAAIPGKILFFIDACHSGNVLGSRRSAVTDVTSMVNELASAENGAIVFTSSTGRQYSWENEAWQNGAFTKAIVEGMKGKADLFKKGKVTVKSLDVYITERVKELTGGQQSPTTIIPNSIPDFPIGVVK